MHAFILAGGFATRLWPLTEKRAKPLLPLAGKPILTHIVEKIPEDIPITVSTNAVFKEGFEEWKKELSRSNIEVLIEDTNHDDHKLGALGAVAKWITEAKINEDILLLTGDNYIGFELTDFLASYNEGIPLLAAHDIGNKEKAKSFGIVVLDKQETPSRRGRPSGRGPAATGAATGRNQKSEIDSIASFEEKPSDPKSTLVSTGCSILPASTLPILVEFAKEHPDNVGGIFEELLRKNLTVECFTFLEPWFDIGSFEAYLEATKALVGDQIIKEERAQIQESQTEGSIVLGPRSKVLKSTLKNVVLFEDCTVENCELTNCILDHHCELKGVDLVGKMIRENTRLVRD
ncbi:NDP-sugar synthase [Patescibacteria group bacterium]|nr:NDP-sugar synthase [Patescibacteria group bacterium]MBU2259096.1 NDP-sugar synthase [Patescibacteria group bacterium]